ncbi:MAG: GNAT family N-acetyltransferase [Spirochaetes bacterium]|nr:GNAT family N-acetyltransferase [Spirochaetota bacterium]
MIKLKRATINDAEKLLDISTKAFNDEMNRVLGRNGGPPGYDSIDEHLRLIDEFFVYLIENDDIVIGSFFLVPHNESHYSLESFCIYPEFQKKGFGFLTLKEIEKSNPHIRKLSLGSFKKSLHIQRLYEKFGFTKVGEDEWEIKYEKDFTCE